VQQAPHAVLAAGLHHLGRQLNVRTLETFAVAPRLIQDADQVHDCIQPLELVFEYGRVVHIGLDHLDRGQHQQIAVTLAVASENTYLVAGCGQVLAQRRPTKPVPPSTAMRIMLMIALRT